MIPWHLLFRANSAPSAALEILQPPEEYEEVHCDCDDCQAQMPCQVQGERIRRPESYYLYEIWTLWPQLIFIVSFDFLYITVIADLTDSILIRLRIFLEALPKFNFSDKVIKIFSNLIKGDKCKWPLTLHPSSLCSILVIWQHYNLTKAGCGN